MNTAFEIYCFRQDKQREDKSLNVFCARPRQLARYCAFANLFSEVKNQIVLSMMSSCMRWHAMQHHLNLHGIFKQGSLFEELEHYFTAMEQGYQQSNPLPATILVMSSKPASRSHPPDRDGKILSPPSENSDQLWPDTTCCNCRRS